MNVLELYSGIGGMHIALKESGLQGEVIAAIDINPVANTVYKYNFPKTSLHTFNICGLTADWINKSNANTIVMSPPCQPFTRIGKKKDIQDPRTDSFAHILKLLPQLHSISAIFFENVKGFETSVMHTTLIETLQLCNFQYQEFLLSPHQFGVPNTRLRYYCIAWKPPRRLKIQPTSKIIMENFEEKSDDCIDCIGDLLEENIPTSCYLSNQVLTRYINIMDIRGKNSKNSCCFTKAYSRYIEGTGSIYCENFESIDTVLSQRNDQSNLSQCDKLLSDLKLRYFTPCEVCRLMSFPGTFAFPPSTTKRQKYALLGNSINVKVVSKIIQLLDS